MKKSLSLLCLILFTSCNQTSTPSLQLPPLMIWTQAEQLRLKQQIDACPQNDLLIWETSDYKRMRDQIRAYQ